MLNLLTWTELSVTWDSVSFCAGPRACGTISRGHWRVTGPGPHPGLRARTTCFTTGSSCGPARPTAPVTIDYNKKEQINEFSFCFVTVKQKIFFILVFKKVFADDIKVLFCHK